jgi:hypothetical protein
LKKRNEKDFEKFSRRYKAVIAMIVSTIDYRCEDRRKIGELRGDLVAIRLSIVHGEYR